MSGVPGFTKDNDVDKDEDRLKRTDALNYAITSYATDATPSTSDVLHRADAFNAWLEDGTDCE